MCCADCSSILVLVYAYAMFQKRLTMISTRDAGQFGKSHGAVLEDLPRRRLTTFYFCWVPLKQTNSSARS